MMAEVTWSDVSDAYVGVGRTVNDDTGVATCTLVEYDIGASPSLQVGICGPEDHGIREVQTRLGWPSHTV